MKFRQEWSILPSAQALFGKTKVSIEQLKEVWDSYTVVICEKSNGQFHFVTGAVGKYAEIGESVVIQHDQTRAHIGVWVVVNEVYVTPEGTTYLAEPKEGVNYVNKAAMAVFK